MSSTGLSGKQQQQDATAPAACSAPTSTQQLAAAQLASLSYPLSYLPVTSPNLNTDQVQQQLRAVPFHLMPAVNVPPALQGLAGLMQAQHAALLQQGQIMPGAAAAAAAARQQITALGYDQALLQRAALANPALAAALKATPAAALAALAGASAKNETSAPRVSLTGAAGVTSPRPEGSAAPGGGNSTPQHSRPRGRQRANSTGEAATDISVAPAGTGAGPSTAAGDAAAAAKQAVLDAAAAAAAQKVPAAAEAAIAAAEAAAAAAAVETLSAVPSSAAAGLEQAVLQQVIGQQQQHDQQQALQILALQQLQQQQQQQQQQHLLLQHQQHRQLLEQHLAIQQWQQQQQDQKAPERLSPVKIAPEPAEPQQQQQQQQQPPQQHEAQQPASAEQLQQQCQQRLQQLPDLSPADAADIQLFSSIPPPGSPVAAPAGDVIEDACTKQADRKHPHERVKQRVMFNLKRKFADLSSQIEGSLCEVGSMVRCKQTPSNDSRRYADLEDLPQLTDADREFLLMQRRHRLQDMVTRTVGPVVKQAMSHHMAWVFNQPVDVLQFADYLQYVSQPMDFGTILSKVENKQYTEPAEVYADALLVFSNARKYNRNPTEDVHYMANKLQEHWQALWRQGVVPKMEEELRITAKEEEQHRLSKASAAREAAALATQDAAGQLVAYLDELHERLAQLRVQAALCCQPLSASARVALADGLQALPTKQLEAALGLVLPRMAPGLLAGGAAAACGKEGQVKLDVELDLSRCTALELRQLQHFVEACRHSVSKQQAALHAQEQQQAQVDTQHIQDNKDKQGLHSDANVAPEGNVNAGALKQLMQGKDAAKSDPAAVEAAARPAVADVDARQPGDDQQQLPVQPDTETAAVAAAVAAIPEKTAVADAVDAIAAPSANSSGMPCKLTGFPLGDFTESSLSDHAGISWPGLLVGSGLKACSRMSLAGDPEKIKELTSAGAAAAAAAVAAAAAASVAGLQQHQSMLLPPRPHGSLKRRSSDTGAARPPLPPAVRPSRLAVPSSAAGPAAGALGSPFAVQAQHAAGGGGGSSAADGDNISQQQQQKRSSDSGGAAHRSLNQHQHRQGIAGASSSTDLQQQAINDQQQQDNRCEVGHAAACAADSGMSGSQGGPGAAVELPPSKTASPAGSGGADCPPSMPSQLQDGSNRDGEGVLNSTAASTDQTGQEDAMEVSTEQQEPPYKKEHALKQQRDVQQRDEQQRQQVCSHDRPANTHSSSKDVKEGNQGRSSSASSGSRSGSRSSSLAEDDSGPCRPEASIDGAVPANLGVNGVKHQQGSLAGRPSSVDRDPTSAAPGCTAKQGASVSSPPLDGVGEMDAPQHVDAMQE